MSATVWVVMDVGCRECGVSTEPVGIYLTEAEAETAADAVEDRDQGWRSGGQSGTMIFEMTLP